MNESLPPEQLLAILVGVGLAVVFVFRWIREAKPAPEPWSHEVEEQIAHPEVQPLCPRCLTPHSDDDWFCSECGLPTSATTNLLPSLYPLSLGDGFRAVAAGYAPPNPLTIIGCLLVSFVWLTFFAPIYWFFLFRRLVVEHRQRGVPAVPEPGGS